MSFYVSSIGVSNIPAGCPQAGWGFSVCVSPARVKLSVLGTAVFLVRVVAVQVGVLSGLCVPTRVVWEVCVTTGSYAWGVFCV